MEWGHSPIFLEPRFIPFVQPGSKENVSYFVLLFSELIREKKDSPPTLLSIESPAALHPLTFRPISSLEREATEAFR